MWREPGFNTRNMQAREARALPLDAVLGKPVSRVDGRMVAKGPNLQQLMRPSAISRDIREVREEMNRWAMAIADRPFKAWDLPRLADIPPGRMGMAADGAVIVGGRCNCSMCRRVDGMGARMVAMDDPCRPNQAAIPPFIDPPGPRMATTAEVEDAKAIALKAGQINQALHDAFAMIPGRVSIYNYAENQPWMQEVKNFMLSKGWKYAGGGYFSVVFTKGELAIKLGTKAEDSGAAYAAWARDNQGLAGVPVIHHIERYGRQSYTVLMPRYAEVKNDETARAVSGGRMGEVSKTYKKIAAFFKGVAHMDLHGDNIMRDPVTGTIIITDPVSFKAGSRP
ncbi:putative kinase [Brevundimonas phage vB_BpoS-Babayka]|uniref:Kinase n=1 Tax=Brevundimonas phage vB_BpoS-Babayka TaxID=2948596 RepID=A0A9E7SLP4_9CAUD|nr:putative kinase [Brevundimonas phage vB_BpoS-Babayka]